MVDPETNQQVQSFRVGSLSSMLSIVPNASEACSIENEFCKASVLLKVLDDLNPSSYFVGKKRRFGIQMRIEFKQDIGGDDIMWCAFFDAPLNVPPLISIFTAFWGFLDPCSQIDLTSAKPFIRSYLMNAMNIINTNPSLHEDQIEDTSLIIPQNTSDHPPHTSDQRKHWAANQENRESVVFKAGIPYYFETYTQHLDVSSFTIRIPGFNVCIKHALDGQPIRFGIKSKDGSKTYLVIEIDQASI